MDSPRSSHAAPAALPAQIDAAEWPEGLIEVARVLDAWGVRGWLKVAPAAADASALLQAECWWLQGPELAPASAPRRLRLQRRLARRHGHSVVALLDGIGERAQADALKGWSILLRRQDFPPADAGEFYWVDLIGCAVRNREGLDLGVVVGLLDSAAQSVLRLQRPGAAAGSAERLIPFVDAYVLEVDVAGKRILADWQPDYD